MHARSKFETRGRSSRAFPCSNQTMIIINRCYRSSSSIQTRWRRLSTIATSTSWISFLNKTIYIPVLINRPMNYSQYSSFFFVNKKNNDCIRWWLNKIKQSDSKILEIRVIIDDDNLKLSHFFNLCNIITIRKVFSM